MIKSLIWSVATLGLATTAAWTGFAGAAYVMGQSDPAAMLREFGFPIFVALFLFGVLWKLSSWTLTHVVKPLIDSHLTLMKDMSTAAVEQVKLLESISQTVIQTNEFSRRHVEIAEDYLKWRENIPTESVLRQAIREETKKH